jgi:polar amino acid transport system substrate-binding protein
MHTLSLVSTPLWQRAAMLAAGLVLAACGKQPEPAPAPAPTTEASAPAPAPAPAKVYVVGTDAAYAPFESQNEKGEIVGFDIDVVSAIAKKGGFEVKFVNTPWEGIFNALAQGDRDMVVSAVTITDERKQTMDFSEPYFDAQQLIAVRNDSRVKSFQDLRKLKVGVQTGTTGDEAVTKLLGKTSTAIKRFESTPLALKELESSGVDAVVADNGVVVHYVANNPGGNFKTVADKEFVPEQYGIAIKKGNAELLGNINKGLADIKADGTYAKIYAQYFGAAPGTSSSPAAASAPAPAAAASK